MKLAGERRAIAAIVFAFFTIFYTVALLGGNYAPGYGKVITSLAGVYGLAFLSLVAGYFWARWYAVGVGLFGVILAVVGLWQLPPGASPERTAVLIVGGLHLTATLMLWGHSMSVLYDGQAAWREKFHMDDSAVQRLGRAVIRAGLSLPLVLIYALAPRQAGEMIVGLVALAFAGLGLRALVRLRTYGVIALAAAGTMLVVLGSIDAGFAMTGAQTSGGLVAMFAGVLLLAAAAPFAAPIVRFARRAA